MTMRDRARRLLRATATRMPPAPRRWLKWAYLRAKYPGRKLECPCCGARFGTFKPAGDPPRRNAECPSCGSQERHRLLWFFLTRSSGLLGGRSARILHVAPEAALGVPLAAMPSV